MKQEPLTKSERAAILKKCFGLWSIERIALAFGVTPNVVKTIFAEYIAELGAGKRKRNRTDSEAKPSD